MQQRFLIIMRHGQETRHGLTNLGVEQVRKNAIALKKLGLSPNIIFGSGIPRSDQTTHTLCDFFQNIRQDTANLMNCFFEDQFDPIAFLNSIDPYNHTVLLSGHDETVYRFCDVLFDDYDMALFFQLIDKNQIAIAYVR